MELIFMHISIENQTRLDLDNGVKELLELLEKQVRKGDITQK